MKGQTVYLITTNKPENSSVIGVFIDANMAYDYFELVRQDRRFFGGLIQSDFDGEWLRSGDAIKTISFVSGEYIKLEKHESKG